MPRYILQRLLDARTAVVGTLALLLCWEVVGRIPVSGIRIFPPLTGIFADYTANHDLYVNHVAATAITSVYGFLIGTAVAFAAALVFCVAPPVERLFRGVNIALFAVPAIAIG